MSWKKDIQEWSQSKGKDVDQQEGLLIADGWDPKKYTAAMKPQLIAYLEWWHTLSDKVKPTPATSLRKNPTTLEPTLSPNIIEIAKAGQWTVWLIEKDKAFAAVASNYETILDFSNLILDDAYKVYQDLIMRLSESIMY